MIDESKRKKLIIASAIFIGLVVCAVIGFFVFTSREDLPPVEPETETTNTETETKPTPAIPETPNEDFTMYKNDVTFEQFGKLRLYAITDVRIDVILFFLAKHAATQSTGTITAFTFDESSIQQTKDGERNSFTFNAKDNAGSVYKVELSYTYSSEADVHIFDANNNIIQSTPTENH